MKGSTRLGEQDEAFAQALCQSRLRLHGTVVTTAVVAAALSGLVLAAVLWNSGRPSLLLDWLVLLALALAVRVAVHRVQRASSAAPALRLRRYRQSCFVHGLAWAVLMLALPALDHQRLVVATVTLTALVGGSLIAGAFDLVAMLVFAAPAIGALLITLLLSDDPTAMAFCAMVLPFLAFTMLAARRAERSVLDEVRLQLGEAERAATAQRLAQEAEGARRELADKHQLLTQMLRGTRQGFWFIDSEGLTTDVNPAMCDLLGRAREELLGRSVLSLFEGPSLDLMQRELEARRLGRVGVYEVDIRRPDGSVAHCQNNATPIFDAAGGRVGSVGLWTDLTQHRGVESALRLYERVANSITDMVSVIGEDERYRLVNDAWCRGTGLSREAALGRSTMAILPFVATAERRRALRDCLQFNDVRVVRGPVEKPGHPGAILETTFSPFIQDLGGVRCVVLVTRDISEQERRRIEQESGAEYLRRTLNATGDAIFATDARDPNEAVRFANQQMLRMWNIPDDRLAQLSAADIMAYAMPLFFEPEAEAQRIQEIIASNRPRESELRLRDGRLLLRRCVPAQIAGRPVRIWSFRDITTEARALKALQISEAERSAVLDAFPGFIAQVDAHLRCTFVNSGMARLLGDTPQSLGGRSMADVLGAEQEQILRPLIIRALAGERVTCEFQPSDQPHQPPLDLHVTLAPGVDPVSGTAIVHVFGVDITARKQAERALIVARNEARHAD
jgi:PAS domain S-box-containing protein